MLNLKKCVSPLTAIVVALNISPVMAVEPSLVEVGKFPLLDPMGGHKVGERTISLRRKGTDIFLETNRVFDSSETLKQVLPESSIENPVKKMIQNNRYNAKKGVFEGTPSFTTTRGKKSPNWYVKTVSKVTTPVTILDAIKSHYINSPEIQALSFKADTYTKSADYRKAEAAAMTAKSKTRARQMQRVAKGATILALLGVTVAIGNELTMDIKDIAEDGCVSTALQNLDGMQKELLN